MMQFLIMGAFPYCHNSSADREKLRDKILRLKQDLKTLTKQYDKMSPMHREVGAEDTSN